MSCRGVEGHRYAAPTAPIPDSAGAWLERAVSRPNSPESRRIWDLVDEGYTPIDWQRDFKSGWRWSERTWRGRIRYGHHAGVDIKAPWELARMQHLPQLALAHALASGGTLGFAEPEIYRAEFRNEVLDFIATNPPRYGVNWFVAMECAIRAINWIVALELFRSAGVGFDAEFELLLARSLHEHGRHIMANLEWSDTDRGNHYLADIVGLLFIATALERSDEADRWLDFAAAEFLREAKRQFHPEGSSFEASTSYHRLSGELVTFGAAVLLRLPEWRSEVTRSLGTLLPLIARFSMDVTKPNGAVAQIGDNDSGRLLKLIPQVRSMTVGQAKDLFANLDGYAELADGDTYWVEEHLDHRPLIGAIHGLTHELDLAAFAGNHAAIGPLVASLACGHRLGSPVTPSDPVDVVTADATADLASIRARIEAMAPEQRRTVRIPILRSEARDLRCVSYPEFGLYLWRSEGLLLAVRCGGVGGRTMTAHAHLDQLSVELNVHGEDWIADPGTYLYTALPKRRDEYRGQNAHAAPSAENARAGILASPFAIDDLVGARCLAFGPNGFAGELTLPGGRSVLRIVVREPGAISILDGSEDGRLTEPTGDLGDWTAFLPQVPFSPGYGIVRRARA
jgi:hypothetical protein